MANSYAALVPESLFVSRFKNISGRDLWCSFIPLWGAMVKAGDVFTVLGDPRIGQNPNEWPRKDSILRTMIEQGLIEMLSAPDIIIDNNVDDGTSATLSVDNANIALVNTTVKAADAAARTLPAITATAVYSAGSEQFTIDWSGTTGILPHDKFTVSAAAPDGKNTVINAGSSTNTVFNAAPGSGTYTFTVTLLAIDGRTSEGQPVDADAV